jgi:hypothetical protein
MLSSRQRIEATGIDALGNVFTGDVERCEVGATHAEALDPRNPVFANELLRCVGAIRSSSGRLERRTT